MIHHPAEQHHSVSNQIQRNSNRMGVQNMVPPPPPPPPPPPQHLQQLLVSIQPTVAVPQSGVLVTMPQGATLITTTAIAQQQPHPKPILGQQIYYDAVPAEMTDEQQNSPEHTNTNTSSVPTDNLANTKEKTPMCLINELARYNKIQHQYRLTGEQGPAHKKLFTVTLKLGNEEYEAEGASIKKAQHSAAALALQQTELKHPPPKHKNNRSNMRNGSGTVTPTVELNALAMKRGERTIYILENGAPIHPQGFVTQTPTFYPRHNIYGPGQPRYNYDPRRNGTGRAYIPNFEARYNYGQYARYHPPGEPFSIRLRVGEREYSGMGYTVQAARHDAASKALDYLKHKEMEEGQQCSAEDEVQHDEICNDLNRELKSPISLVHELALKRNLAVTFEVLSEKGPPHMKVFITQCRVGDFLAEGEGNGKKISKKRAAEKMLEELSKLEPFPNINNVSLKRKRVVTKKKQRNLIKVGSDKSSEIPEEINPISRLIQIQQANKEKEPVYTVVEERGAPRRREFVIEASVNGHISSGIGPNKKVAKRNAADALLAILGYTDVTPTPATAPKPAIKAEKETETVEKLRKVTFMEEKQETPVGGSGGRQLVPGLLLVNDQSGTLQQNKAKVSDSETVTIGSGNEPKQNAQIQVPGKVSQATQSISTKEQLLYLAQLLGIEVQFSDFPKANHDVFLTLVSVSTNPPQFCHGEGTTAELSHEKAAKEALNILSELGLDNVSHNTDEPVSDIDTPTVDQVIPESGVNENDVEK